MNTEKDTKGQEGEQAARPHSATYSPDDNKLRLYPAYRLDAEEYARVKAAGFRWAPRQELFVAPAWTPEREDLLLSMCDEIGDEDTSLCERAEERADRFEDYSEKRLRDAEQARETVQQVAGRFEGGQPILVGHHSERKARKDKERIERGMAKAVKMWDTSEYWKRRAAGALFHAKYKERQDVRARRIKKLESEQRKMLKHIKELESFAEFYESADAMTATLRDGRPKLPEVLSLYNSGLGDDGRKALREGALSLEEAAAKAAASKRAAIAHCDRWGAHYANRLEYERAMLQEQGGLVSDRFDIQPGGRVLSRGNWYPVLKINRKDGQLTSVTVAGHWKTTISIERVTDYRPPAEGDAEVVARVMKQPPLLNYPGEGFDHITDAQWKAKHKDYKGSRIIGGEPEEKREFSGRMELSDTAKEAARTVERHRVRTWVNGGRLVPVYITDKKRTDPKRVNAPEKVHAPKPEPAEPREPRQKPKPAEQAELFGAMREALKQGVQTVVAPQLFPTPEWLAEKVVSYAGIEPGHDVLEPSAGTGALLKALPCVRPAGSVTAVEIRGPLAHADAIQHNADKVVCADFLSCNGNLGKFDRIVMNPPFANGADIQHIRHALTFLKPGGRLVAICANGPRQRAAFMDHAEHWEDLPEGTFKEQGTNVNTALVVLVAE